MEYDHDDDDDDEIQSVASSTAPLKMDPWNGGWYTWLAAGVLLLLIAYISCITWYYVTEKQKMNQKFILMARIRQHEDMMETFPDGYRSK
jgi:hypothetical protein